MRDCGAENIKDFNLSTLQAEMIRISEREDEVCVCVSVFIQFYSNSKFVWVHLAEFTRLFPDDSCLLLSEIQDTDPRAHAGPELAPRHSNPSTEEGKEQKESEQPQNLLIS